MKRADGRGRLVLWNDDKGFGFVRPESGEKDFFVHISAFRKGMTRRPEVGDRILFLQDHKAPEQRRIIRAEIEGMPYAGTQTSEPADPMWLRALINVVISIPFLLSMFLLWRTGNPLPFASYTFLSVLAILIYGLDKTHSLMERWRIPEANLHILELLGGWPGALLAQRNLRHKNKKASYQLIFWSIVAVHYLAWTLYLAARWEMLGLRPS